MEFEPTSLESKSWPLSFFHIRTLNTCHRQTLLLQGMFDTRQRTGGKGFPDAKHELGKCWGGGYHHMPSSQRRQLGALPDLPLFEALLLEIKLVWVYHNWPTYQIFPGCGGWIRLGKKFCGKNRSTLPHPCPAGDQAVFSQTAVWVPRW